MEAHAREERRVAAIVFSDIVDYTARMAESESHGVQLRDHHRACWERVAGTNGGAIVDENGDELLLLFGSSVAAVRSALEIQDLLARTDEMRLRMGIHMADVLIRDGAPYGDGVNLAARIRGTAQPGQIVVSEEVARSLRPHPDLRAARMGTRRLQNVPQPVALFAVSDEHRPRRRGWGRAAWVVAALVLVVLALAVALPEARGRLVAGVMVRALRLQPPVEGHEIAFAHSADGTRIAWGSLGSGPAVLFVQPWLTNAEKMPRALPILAELSQRHRVVHYDGRGFGLSQRGTEHSLEKQLDDLETVVDAAGLDRFAIWGFSSGTPVAVQYAARHSERVTRLAVYGGFARSPMNSAQVEAIAVLLGDHLGTDRFESFFRELLVPDASDLQVYFLNQALTPDATRADAAAYFRTLGHLDVREAARAIRVPTLVAHRRDDQLMKLEAGLELASLIPDAELLILSGQNHLFLPGEEEGRRFASALAEFMSAEPDGGERVVAPEGIERPAP